MTIDIRRIGPIEVAVLGREIALSLILSTIAARRSSLICFANAHTVNTARKFGDFSAVLARALVLNDGVGVDIASKWLYGKPFPANLNGTDLTPEVLSRLPAGTKLFLLGASMGVAERAADMIAVRHPHVFVVGCHHGFFGDDDEASIVNHIKQSQADLVLAGMGHPRQELWSARHVDRIGTPIMCVGAILDFYAGTAKRAPTWIRRCHLEWAYRLMREPRRLAQRYLVGNFAFLAHIIFSAQRSECVRAYDMAEAGPRLIFAQPLSSVAELSAAQP